MGEQFRELNDAYKRLLYEASFKEKGFDHSDPRNDPTKQEYWDIRRRSQTHKERQQEKEAERKMHEKDIELFRKIMLMLAVGIFFGTIFPALFIASDEEAAYNISCDCDKCLRAKMRHNPSSSYLFAVRNKRD